MRTEEEPREEEPREEQMLTATAASGGVDRHPVSKPERDHLFERFWGAYPRKVGKAAARRRFDLLTKKEGRIAAEAIIAGSVRFAADPNLPPKQYVPHPSTWLNEGRWEDEALPQRGDVQPDWDAGHSGEARTISGAEWLGASHG